MEARSFALQDLVASTRKVPLPGPGELLLQVKAVSLNFRDIAVLTQNYYPNLKLPFVPASDASTEVAAIGAGVTGWEVGDRAVPIYTQGWHDGLPSREMRAQNTLGGPLEGVLQDYIVVPAQDVVRPPEFLSHAEASTLPIAALTACGVPRI